MDNGAQPEGENGAVTAEVPAVSEGQQETYLILVDDGSGAVDNLNSQTLYIDPSQLENGNMVLMTNDGVPVSAQGVVAAPAAAGGDAATVVSHEQILAAAAVQPGVAAPNAVAGVLEQQVAIAPTATTVATEAPIVTAAVAPTATN